MLRRYRIKLNDGLGRVEMAVLDETEVNNLGYGGKAHHYAQDQSTDRTRLIDLLQAVVIEEVDDETNPE